ncbi:organic cation transporter protein [Galendromus occidentalis]|uniref:Organic cation transporter protein n=1 Tax=Galendromus occidentalis TaxID=34638 RepID=A0AAJ6QTK1_9ACAR|nr:organic cation transporter protein [Galendromus occidentalis]
MDFDEVLIKVGELGRYQKMLFLSVCVPAAFPAAITIFSPIFISDVPGHHCHPTVTSNKANLFYKSLAPEEDYRSALNALFLPRDSEGSFVRCQQYDVDADTVIDQVVSHNQVINSTTLSAFVAKNRWASVQCLNGWDYDTGEYSETLATKFNVVCDQEWLISTAQSCFFLGGTVGSVFFGWISDKWGRRPALLLATGLMVVGNIMEIYPPDYLAYIIMRFGLGFSYASVYNLSFLIVAEMIGSSKRMLSSAVCNIAFSFGMMLLAYVAHLVDHWRSLKAVVSLPMLLLIAYYWVVPESPRWLISQRRIDEAEKIVRKMADSNGVTLESNFLRNNLAEEFTSAAPSTQKSIKVGLSLLLMYPRVTIKILVMAIVWTVTGMVYQGMSFAVPELPSKTYIAFFLSALCEVPGILFVWATMQSLGRRSCMCGSLGVSGIFSIATACVSFDLPWLAVLLPSLAKLASTITFTVMYILSGELFPTVIRGFAFGVASTVTQLGLVILPYILYLGKIYGRPVPFVILGILAVLTAFLILTLPETLNVPLPTTLEESENYQEYARKKRETRKTPRSPK